VGGERAELFGWRLGRGHDEQGILEAAPASRPGGATGRLDHRRGTRINANGERGRLRGGCGEHRSTVTGTDIDRDPLVAGNDMCDLTDVHLNEAPSDDCLDHAAHDTAARPVRHYTGRSDDITATERK